MIYVSWGCYNKLPQPRWLKTEIYSPTDVSARSPKSRCEYNWFLPEAPKEKLFHASLLASVDCQQSLAFLGL